ncbi:MAG: COX15/CtaA family protein [Chitinophagales bacterium]
MENKKQLGYLLILVLFVIYIQVMVGGITRLTGSGLSMTDWKIVTGTIPPLNEAEWMVEFEQYKATPQYQKLNKGMSLTQFQSIYFWEWLHRVWGRWGFMFLLAIFAYFLFKKKLSRTEIKRFAIVLVLYICQGLLGWIMVKSGLVDMPWVSHYRLTAHLCLAIFLFAYILWFVADIFVPKDALIQNEKLRKFAFFIIVIMIIQIIFGGFMSGLRAAMNYPSWPDMNGQYLPDNLFFMKPFWKNFGENVTTIQFTHRNIAYLLTILILVFWQKARHLPTANPYFRPSIHLLLFVLITQVSLGILVLLNSKQGIPVDLGVAHQAVGLLLLSTMLFIRFQFQKLPKI